MHCKNCNAFFVLNGVTLCPRENVVEKVDGVVGGMLMGVWDENAEDISIFLIVCQSKTT